MTRGRIELENSSDTQMDGLGHGGARELVVRTFFASSHVVADAVRSDEVHLTNFHGN